MNPCLNIVERISAVIRGAQAPTPSTGLKQRVTADIFSCLNPAGAKVKRLLLASESTLEISDHKAIYPERKRVAGYNQLQDALAILLDNVNRVRLKSWSKATPQNGLIREGKFYV